MNQLADARELPQRKSGVHVQGGAAMSEAADGPAGEEPAREEPARQEPTQSGGAAPTSSAGAIPFQDSLLKVVKTLHKDPVLAYGIGAGIVLVGALALTASLSLVLVVAAVFVVVLIGAILGRTQQKRGGGIFARAFSLRRAPRGPGGRQRRRGHAAARRGPHKRLGHRHSTKGAKIGNVKYGGDDDSKDG